MSINEGLWSAKLPNGDVRSGTLGQLNEAFRAGHLGESTLVCAAGSANWIRLVDVLGGAAAFSSGTPSAAPQLPSQPPPPVAQPVAPAVAGPVTTPMNGHGEPWQVKLGNGEIRSGTRQQLEEAFRLGQLDANALVLAPGTSEWSKVGILLSQSQPPPIPSTHPPAPANAMQSSSAPPAIASAPSPAAAPNGSGEQWQVRLPNGQVRAGTRKQLEEAYNAGHLNEGALVLPAGSSEWVRLGDLMDRRPAPPGAPIEPLHSATGPTAAVASPGAAAEPGATAEPAPAMPADSASVDSAPVTVSNPAVLDAEPTPARLPESVTEEPSSWDPAPAASASFEAKAPEPVWQVKLTLKQLRAGLDAGLFDEQTPVLAAGADEWTVLGEVRRAQLAQEPASRTQPWPATAGASRASPPGE